MSKIRIMSVAVFVLMLAPIAAAAQISPANRSQQSESTAGTVASSSAGSIVVETEANEFVLFVIDRQTARPTAIPRGSRVTVTSRPGSGAGDPRIATRITVDSTADTRVGAAGAPGGAGQPPSSVIPPEVRRLERQIERQVRRFGVGVRGGIALDPELVAIGAHARVGPFFSDNLLFRPNVEFAYGEVTALFAVNLEAVYQLPITPRQGRWSAYMGAGPTFAFVDQSFAADDDGRDIDFDNFGLDAGFSILAGVEYPNGAFIELKGTAYSVPNVRLLVGFSF